MLRQRWCLVLATALVLTIPSATLRAAEKGDREVGFRLLWVTGSASSGGSIAETGNQITLSSGPGMEFDWIFWTLDELTVELSLGVSAHPVGTSGGSLDGLDGGTLWRVPVSAVAQYHPQIFGEFDPYVGLGLVYNVLSYSMSSEYGQWLSKGKFSNEVDLVAQIGLNYDLDLRWSANLDLRFMGMTTTGTFTPLDGSTVADVDFSLNPWVVGLGFRYRY